MDLPAKQMDAKLDLTYADLNGLLDASLTEAALPVAGSATVLGAFDALGIEVHPRPENGFVHYRKCRVRAAKQVLRAIVAANQTALIDITLTRVVHKETMRLDRTTEQKSFKKVKPGDETVN